jgi:ABC-type transport system involved in multi-copper enzyme maturation permease subunit
VIAQLRSELLKLRTTRTLAVLLLAAAALTLLGALIEGASPSVAKLAQEKTQREMFGAAGSGAVLFATLVGLISVTSEFRYGTMRLTLLFQPRRGTVLAAKLVAALLAGVLLAVICVAVAFGAGLAILAVRDVDLALTDAHASALLFGPPVACALSAMLGVAVGTLIRNQVGAIVAVVAYGFLIDATLFAAAPSVGRYLPGKAGDGLTGLPVDHLLAPGAGAAVFLAWTLAFMAAAAVRNQRSDV